MSFYPFKPTDNTVSQRTISPMAINPDQLDLAPYLPQLAQQAHLQLAAAHMELANDIVLSTKSTNIEKMSNSYNIINYAQEQAKNHILHK